jgi:hypothetical protein
MSAPEPLDRDDPAPAAPPAVPLEWSFNPWRQSPRVAISGALAIVAIGILLISLRLMLLASAALLIAFVVSLSPSFLVARCRVDGEGVARRIGPGRQRRAWGQIRSAVVQPDGLFVSPLARPGALAAFRGLWLPVPRDGRPALLAELRRRLAQHGL